MVKGAPGSIDRLQRAAAGGMVRSLGREEPSRQGKQGYSCCSYTISVIYERSVAKPALTPDIPSLFMITIFSLLYFYTRMKLYNVSENALWHET